MVCNWSARAGITALAATKKIQKVHSGTNHPNIWGANVIVTCDVLNAEKALEWGLISQIVPQEKLLVTAMELAKKIVNNPPEAIRRAKRLLRLSQNINLNTALEMAASQQSLLQMTNDHKEAIRALIERRKPEYKNS